MRGRRRGTEYGDDNVFDTDTEQDTHTHTMCTVKLSTCVHCTHVDSFTVAVSPPAPHTPIPPHTHPHSGGIETVPLYYGGIGCGCCVKEVGYGDKNQLCNFVY